MATFLSQIAKITDHLYLSSFAGATEYNVLKYNISCVITVCKEIPKVEVKNVESIKLDVQDKPTEALHKYFDYVADKINEVVNKKGICLVHCVAGISRSASMILVYLMKYQRMSLREAHTYVKSRRPFIRPNLGFWKQLVDYELTTLGKNSVRIIQSPIGWIPDIYENEVRSLVWARQNPESAGTLAASNSPTSSSFSMNNPAPTATFRSSNNKFSSRKTSMEGNSGTMNLPGLSQSNNNETAAGGNGNTQIISSLNDVIIPKFTALSIQNQIAESEKLAKTRQQHQLVSNRMKNNDLIASISKSNYTTTYQSSFQNHPRN